MLFKYTKRLICKCKFKKKKKKGCTIEVTANLHIAFRENIILRSETNWNNVRSFGKLSGKLSEFKKRTDKKTLK